MKAYVETGSIFPPILNFDSRWRQIVPFKKTLAALLKFQLNRKVSGSQSRSGRFGNEGNLLPFQESKHDP
jgi:hypothetical protein